MGWGYEWRPYVSVFERQRKAQKALDKLRRKGVNIQPVHIEGRAIARTFWGKAWCDHLEALMDFENRLPRGRTYVRNGSVCHLDIGRGRIEAKVQGSELYTVSIEIKPLGGSAWKSIKSRSMGSISSILDLLQGRLSAGVMAVVTDPQEGMFPKPKEIAMSCSCPDWAEMCKHIAATLYGVGARLDERPELLFLLRGVDHEELISARAEDAVGAAVGAGRHRRVADSELEEVFGIEMEKGPAKPLKTRGSAASTRKDARAGAKASSTKRARPFPAALKGSDVTALRERLKLDLRDFAQLLGLSRQIVVIWEKSAGPLNLRPRSRKALEQAWKIGRR